MTASALYCPDPHNSTRTCGRKPASPSTNPPQPIASRYPQMHFLSSICLLLALLPSIDSTQLPVCSAFQACAAEVSQFPLLVETAANMIEVTDGSGQEGSGQGVQHQEESFPLYDEFVSRSSPFDYQTDADLSQTQICRCPDGEQQSSEDSQCNFLSTDFSGGAEHVMSVDKTLRLAFCRPVNQLFKTKCLGRRGLIRIIGQVDAKTGEAITSVNDTAVFCRCDSGFFQRELIEPWGDKYAFTYRCAWTPPSSLKENRL